MIKVKQTLNAAIFAPFVLSEQHQLLF